MVLYNFSRFCCLFMILLLAQVNLSCAQSTSKDGVVTININDFGAKPNDNKNDQAAFEDAATFINKRGGNCVLKIPAGTYIVGRQIMQKDKNWYLKGVNTLNLSKVKNVTIQGVPGKTILKFDVGFRYGSFNPATGLSTNNDWAKGLHTVSAQRADLGTVIYIFQSNDVHIKDLILDGNFYPATVNNMNKFSIKCFASHNAKYMPNKINVGGGYGDLQIQLSHYGLFVFHSGNVYLDNITAKRFGLDGLQIANREDVASQKTVRLNNRTFDYNGRTGVSVTGGNDIVFNACTISNTGQCMYSATGSGVDLEAQRDNLTSKKMIEKVVFKNCHFSSNKEGGIIALHGFGSKNVLIESCTFNSTRRPIRIGAKVSSYKIINNTFKGVNNFQGGSQAKFIKTEKELKTLIPNADFQNNKIIVDGKK